MAEGSFPIDAMFSFVRHLFLIAALLGFAEVRPAWAAPVNPLGATPQEIDARYGPVLKHNARVRHHQILEGGTILDGDLHGKNGLIIRVVYHQYRAVLLEFTRATGEMTVADVNTLLTGCAADSTWEPGKDSTDKAKLYHRADGAAVAHWDMDESSLLIAAEGDEKTGNLMNRLSD